VLAGIGSPSCRLSMSPRSALRPRFAQYPLARTSNPQEMEPVPLRLPPEQPSDTDRRSLLGERIKCAEARHSGAMCLSATNPPPTSASRAGPDTLFATLRLASKSLHPWERDGASPAPLARFRVHFSVAVGTSPTRRLRLECPRACARAAERGRRGWCSSLRLAAG
jgi:hypothetical protein